MKRRCVFLDRDGVINQAAPEGEYITRWEDFRLIPAILDWIRLFKAMGFLVIVVTNQRAVARGLMSAEQVDEIHRRMREILSSIGAEIDDLYCCLHEEGTCECRKPRPGMVLEAARKWDIDLTGSVMIGDSRRDRELAENTGLTFVEVSDGKVRRVTPRPTPHGARVPTAVQQRVTRFVQERLKGLAPDVRDIMNSSFLAWYRYYCFLQILRDRYAQTPIKYTEDLLQFHEERVAEASAAGRSVTRPLTEEEAEIMEGLLEIGYEVHLGIEAFFVFAKILLDRVASTFRYFFWEKPNWSHHQLQEHFSKICSSKNFTISDPRLPTLAAELEERIVKYRNYRIEHVKEHRLLFGTSWGPDKKARIAPILLNPTPGEAELTQNPSSDIEQTMEQLDHYLSAVIDFMDANAQRRK